MNFPKEVIISINTHGRYNWGEMHTPHGERIPNEDLELDKFVYSPPNENSKVIYVSAVSVGIINYRSKIVAENSNESLKNHFEQYLEKKKRSNTSELFDVKDEFKYLDDIYNELFMKMMYDEEINKLKTFAKIKNLTQEDLNNIKNIETNIKRLSNYFRHFDQSYSFKIYEKNDIIYNKTYSTSPEEKQNSNHDFNIKILNLPENQNDIFTLANVPLNNYNIYNISLKQIIEFLNNQGVENIYIYDFSCGGGVCHVPSRAVRRLRRQEKMTLKKLPKSLKRYTSKRYRQKSLKHVSFADVVQKMSAKKTPKTSKTPKTFKTPKTPKTTRKRQKI